MTLVPEIFIGSREFLKQMKLFLANNRADNRGYFSKEQIDARTKKFLGGKDPDEYAEESNFDDIDINDLSPLRLEFFKPGEENPVDETRWNFYQNAFNIQKSRAIQKKMADIRKSVSEEYEDIMVSETFLTLNHARHNLIEYTTRLSTEGLNPYKFLNRENIYAVNANLTFYMNSISNVVNELLNLNETNILKSIVDTAKLMKEDNTSAATMKSYIESKIFQNATEKISYLIENPFIDASRYAEKAWLLLTGTVLAILYL